MVLILIDIGQVLTLEYYGITQIKDERILLVSFIFIRFIDLVVAKVTYISKPYEYTTT